MCAARGGGGGSAGSLPASRLSPSRWSSARAMGRTMLSEIVPAHRQRTKVRVLRKRPHPEPILKRKRNRQPVRLSPRPQELRVLKIGDQYPEAKSGTTVPTNKSACFARRLTTWKVEPLRPGTFGRSEHGSLWKPVQLRTIPRCRENATPRSAPFRLRLRRLPDDKPTENGCCCSDRESARGESCGAVRFGTDACEGQPGGCRN